jgi:hypothetical protein
MNTLNGYREALVIFIVIVIVAVGYWKKRVVSPWVN